jgi:prevent-host-death family protein
MKLGASEFKARCLAVLDRVHQRGEEVTITKRGRVVARLVPAGDADDRPWQRLRKTARWHGDWSAPALKESEIEALK